ncbi:MAG TPA: ABC transporter substrate-binding protein [Mycobacteriales bacterium]|nr:ABC transporter substrate-binding protein [Mycobacteriales bacterium]
MALGPTQRTFLRGYGPLACLLLAFVLMAAFVPTNARERVTLAQGTAAAPGTGVTGTVPGSGASVPGAVKGSTTVAGTQVAKPGQLPAQTTKCSGKQVPGDPYSPPCIEFSGSNGGSTSRGVTSSTITVAYRQTNDPGFQQTLASIGGAQFADTPADIRRTIQGLADYFNKHFQFYGRKLNFVFYNGQGSQTNELLGGGQEQASADALHVSSDIKAFADMSAATEPYGDSLSRDKVLNFGEPYLSAKWFSDRSPYAWSLASDCTSVSEASADIAVKQMLGKNAVYAGDTSFQKSKRKLAILAPDNPWYQDCVKNAEAIFKANGFGNQESIPYQLDLSTLSSQAASIVSKLKADHVTTVVCGCDPIFPVYLTQKADEQQYNPEWAVIGVALTDQDIVGQLFDQKEWAHAIGVTYQGPTIPYQATLGYAAYKSVRSDEPAQAVDLIYAQMYMLALGIDLAGPDLTPQTYLKGMQSYSGGTGEFGTWGFPPGDYTPTRDGAEIYWDPNATSAYNGKQGAYVFASGRYQPGHWPQAAEPPHTPYRAVR